MVIDTGTLEVMYKNVIDYQGLDRENVIYDVFRVP